MKAVSPEVDPFRQELKNVSQFPAVSSRWPECAVARSEILVCSSKMK
jgi:hypothetical protein